MSVLAAGDTEFAGQAAQRVVGAWTLYTPATHRQASTFVLAAIDVEFAGHGTQTTGGPLSL